MRLRLLSLSALLVRIRNQASVLAHLKKELLRRQAICLHPRRPSMPEGRDVWPMRCPDCEYRWIEYRDLPPSPTTIPVVDAAFALRDRTLRRKAREQRARKARA